MSEALQIGDWRVSPSLDTIARGNETHKLEPRTMRLLVCLAESAGEVVSVDRLLTEVWTGVVVGPASVYQAVSQLRKLLQDSDPNPTYIATVPRKGYRLIAPVQKVDPLKFPDSLGAGPPELERSAEPSVPDRNATAPRARWKIAAFAVAALIGAFALSWLWRHRDLKAETEIASIVVLPFVDMSVEKTGQQFCDGLTEELSNWLAQIPTLRVVARTSAFAYRGPGADVRAIGKALDTNHILEGSMRRFGDHMRITVQLIDARNGYHMWSAEYDRPMDDTIKIQDEISRAVAQNLAIRLTEDTNRRFAARSSDDPRAYQLYLSARYYQHQRTTESNKRAIDLYNQVIAADPKFALAYVGLSYSLLNQQWLEGRPIAAISGEVERLVAVALELDPRLPDAYVARAALRSDQNRVAEAQNDLRLGISLNPNDSVAIAELGRLWLYQGKPRDAVASFNRAIGLDPLDFRLQTQLCTALEDLARFGEAQAACERAYALQPDNAEVVDGLTWLAWSRGATVDALHWSGEAIRLDPGEFEYYWTRAELYWTLGLARPARETLEKGRAVSSDYETADAALGSVAFLEGGAAALRSHLRSTRLDQSQHAVTLFEAAYLHLLLEEPSAVVELTQRAFAAPDRSPQLADTPWSARVGESTQLNLAVAEIASHDPAAATRRLDEVLAMLDRMIDAGVERSATYELRAKVQALRGNDDAAMQDLHKAARLGWRRVWWAEHEPYFATLRNRPDFQALLHEVGASNDDLIEKLKTAATPPV